jgi:hypothetical protein
MNLPAESAQPCGEVLNPVAKKELILMSSWYANTCKALDLVLDICNIVHRSFEYFTVEDSTMVTSLSLEASLDNHKIAQDRINLAFLVTEYSIVEVFSIALTCGKTKAASILLKHDGGIDIEAGLKSELVEQNTNANSLVAGSRLEGIFKNAVGFVSMANAGVQMGFNAATMYNAETPETPETPPVILLRP